MTNSIVFRGRALVSDAIREVEVRVQDGSIVSVGEGATGAADVEIELTPNQLLMPAAVDGLCAMRDEAEAERDTVDTVSKAALASGVGFLADQANTAPRINTGERAHERARFVAERCLTHYSINAHPPIDIKDLRAYREAGIVSLQAFPWDVATWNTPRDTDVSSAIYSAWAEAGFETLFFPDELALRETPWRDAGESYALQALLRRLPKTLKARLLITQALSASAIIEAKERLPNVAIAVAPHSLFLSREEAFRRIGIGATQVPPLREQDDVDALAAYAAAGAIDMVVSHHAPHRMGDKYSEAKIAGEFTPKAGYSAIDLVYPLLMTRLGPELAARLFSEAPAKHFGLAKGRIAKGADADLIVFQKCASVVDRGVHEGGGITAGVWKIDPTLFQSKGKVTPFTGERLDWRAEQTWLAGALAFDRATMAFNRVSVRQARL
ncbi:amidohydrolase family protein [Terricaulis sp.]|uniref:amidohydrolase family protein n=1 Tax=Terricaulis sp. TaxID=2768686 RepID=UPI003784C355